MPFYPISLGVDLTPIENRLDAIEAAGPDVIAGVLVGLRAERMSLMYLLRIVSDGDPVVDADGNEVVWTPALRLLADAELTEINRIITAL